MEEQPFYIKPEPPYVKFSHGKVSIGVRDLRRTIRLYGPGVDAFQTTYARYLFQIDYWKKHGSLIPEGYEVDHIDEIKLNDSVENLQLLTPYENRQKNNYAGGATRLVLSCPICGWLFTISEYDDVRGSLRTCSDDCKMVGLTSKLSKPFRDYLSDKQVVKIIKVYREFPSGQEYKCEILKTNNCSFYPNTLSNPEVWLPEYFLKDLFLVDPRSRSTTIFNLAKAGVSERQIADRLKISRSVVQATLGRTWRQKLKRS